MAYACITALLGIWILQICQAEVSVYYVCFEEGHPSVVDIQCAPGMVINIEEAGYGRSKYGLCRDLIKNTQNHKCYAQTNVTMECCALPYCDLQVKRGFVETCDYRPASFLKIVYECVPAKSRFICGPPRLNDQTGEAGDLLPMHIPGQHILGDVDLDYTQQSDTEQNNHQNTNTNINNSETALDGTIKVRNETVKTVMVKTQSRGASTTKLKAPSKKMAVMMITSPPDTAGYKIVNEDGTEVKQDNAWHILHGNDAVAVWACLGVGLLIIFLLTMVLIYLCRKSPNHAKAQEVSQHESNEGQRSKPQYQESEFGCKRYPETSSEHNNNKMHTTTGQVGNNRKDNSHTNRAFTADYVQKVGVSGSKKRSHHTTSSAGVCRDNGLIVTPQDPVSACLRSPSSIISLSDDENSSLTDSGVETNSKQGSRQNSRGKREVKKKTPILKASNNRSTGAKRPMSLDMPPECHKMTIRDTNDVHDIIVL